MPNKSGPLNWRVDDVSGTFGCATGAFSYSSLSNRKNAEADSHNPNLYSSIEDLKDNRVMENIYDEIQVSKRVLRHHRRRGEVS